MRHSMKQAPASINPFLEQLSQDADTYLHKRNTKEKTTLSAASKTFFAAAQTRLDTLRHTNSQDSPQARTALMDTLLAWLFEQAIQNYTADHGPLPCPLSLIALGSYGRRELCPFSDIDLSFIYPDNRSTAQPEDLQKTVADSVLYPLWDLGLTVGHSSRTLKETLQEAKNHIKSKNALLDARWIAGDKGLFAHFQKTYQKFYRRHQPQKYLQEQLESQIERRRQHGNTVFLQEPDIKTGVGSLRDYQTLLWMARIKLGVGSLSDLQDQDYLSGEERLTLESAYAFLLQVRCALHRYSPRPTERLELEKQTEVATELGYADPDSFERVKHFMRDYYSHAHALYRTSQLLEQRLVSYSSGRRPSFKTVIQALRKRPARHLDGFVLIGETLGFHHESVFESDPERLIRVFRHAQELDADFDPELTALIRQSLALIDDAVVQSASANTSFRSILQQAGKVYPILSKMHELGVLEHFIPEFSGITHLIQHEYYHRYTVDIHTLNTIEELDQVFANATEASKKYCRVLHETDAPTLLYLILLLHDIGKGQGIKNHAENGTQIAKPILKRMGLPSSQCETVLFVIRKHLILSRIWQRFDVDDPKTAELLAQEVHNAEALRLLYVHTFCDARGTADGLWNTYKDILHTQLFGQTLAEFGVAETRDLSSQTQAVSRLRNSLKAQLTDFPPSVIESHFDSLPDTYFIHNSHEDIARHLELIDQWQKQKQTSPTSPVNTLPPPVIHWRTDLNLSLTLVDIISHDQTGLFYQIAGAFSVVRANILNSRAFTRKDHITLDTFYVSEWNGGPVEHPQAETHFCQSLKSALFDKKDLLPTILTQAKKYSRPHYLKTPSKHRVPIDSRVHIYYEKTLDRNIVEIQTEDHIGLLYQLSKVIYSHGFDITFARISTERKVAIDTFYIEPASKAESPLAGTPASAQTLAALRESLNQIIDEFTSLYD